MPQKYTADSSEVDADQTGSMLQHAIDLAFTHYYSDLSQPDIHKFFPNGNELTMPRNLLN